MKKYRNFLWIILVPFLFVMSCNKDEDIIEENTSEENGSDFWSGFAVLEYLPAPGQFINDKTSGFNDVKSMAQAIEYAQKRLDRNLYVSLGAWGGYLVVKAKESIRNNGGYEFSIAGNAIDSSNEAGIVWIMEDRNQNGFPDDEWYELKGSYFRKTGYQRNYKVTYFRPNDRGDVKWIDSDGEEGYIKWLESYHSQEYYPAWVKEDSYTLKGSRLPSQAIQDQETGIWTNLPFKWGYADNNGEDSLIEDYNGMPLQKNFFRISDAIDENGDPIILEKIDFIKVQTGINGNAGIIGENSTEVCGFFRENR